MTDLIDPVLRHPAGFWVVIVLLAVGALVLSSYLRPRQTSDPLTGGLRQRLLAAWRQVTGTMLLWLLPFGIGITLTLSLAIVVGERFDGLPYPVASLLLIYGGSSLMAAWALRRWSSSYRRWWSAVHPTPPR